MALIISSSGGEKLFKDKEVINVGSHQSCDYQINSAVSFILTVQYNATLKTCTIINTFSSNKLRFKGATFQKIDVANVCTITIADSNEFIKVKLTEESSQAQKSISAIGQEDFTEEDMKGLYAADVNPATRIKIEKRKVDLETARVGIIKEVSYVINDLRNKLNTNFRNSILLHAALFISSLIYAFGVSNFLMGLPIESAKDFINMPTNITVFWAYTFLLFGLGLLLKQGTYLFLRHKNMTNPPKTSRMAENFLIYASAIAIVVIYVINLIYYMNIDGFVLFAILISIFFAGIFATVAISCGYFKMNSSELAVELDKHEYRADFESIIKEYQLWIERYINNLGKTKIQNIKDKLFNLQIKSVGETLIGILTAPFLAYGVSNTLALCFPEAAGWIRISGLRFSPIFLVLATFLIIFAFFAFVNSFLCTKKIQASQVIKQDGFSDFQHHGVTIFGLQAVKRLNSERVRSIVIACSIIGIEFVMNVSYFMSEIGGDMQGIFLSIIAALVPTALLIAETYMLSQTKFDIYVQEEILSKVDKD